MEGSGLEDAGQRIHVGTIHAFCKQFLNRYSGIFQDYKVLDAVKAHLLVERYSRECSLEALGLSRWLNDIKLFCTCIEKMADDYSCRELWPQKQREVIEQYRSALHSRRFMDFSLLLLETMEQIRANPQAGEYLKSIRYFIVDEYQDVDDLQEKLIASIAAAGANICVGGDDGQTIYQFRGSNTGNMISFARLWACWKGVLQEERLNAGFRQLRRTARSGRDGYSLPLSGILRDFAELTGFLAEGFRIALPGRRSSYICAGRTRKSCRPCL